MTFQVSRELQHYYAGMAVIIASFLALDLVNNKPLLYEWVDFYFCQGNLPLDAFAWIKALTATVNFRASYHSPCTPLFSYVWGYTASRVSTVGQTFMFRNPLAQILKAPNLMRYTVLWLLVNFDSYDFVYKFGSDSTVQTCIFVSQRLWYAALFTRLDGNIEVYDDHLMGLLTSIIPPTFGACILALEQKLSTGEVKATMYTETSYAFIYDSLATLVYYFSTIYQPTSSVIMSLHKNLSRDTIVAIIEWINIWNDTCYLFLGEEANEPSPWVEGFFNILTTNFRQPDAVLKSVEGLDDTPTEEKTE